MVSIYGMFATPGDVIEQMSAFAGVLPPGCNFVKRLIEESSSEAVPRIGQQCGNRPAADLSIQTVDAGRRRQVGSPSAGNDPFVGRIEGQPHHDTSTTSVGMRLPAIGAGASCVYRSNRAKLIPPIRDSLQY
jgi:hypothetical protein